MRVKRSILARSSSDPDSRASPPTSYSTTISLPLIRTRGRPLLPLFSRSQPKMQRHSFQALNSTFVVDSEYQFTKELGQGAYGCVVAAKHRRSGEGCAIKKITNINTKVRIIFI